MRNGVHCSAAKPVAVSALSLFSTRNDETPIYACVGCAPIVACQRKAQQNGDRSGARDAREGRYEVYGVVYYTCYSTLREDRRRTIVIRHLPVCRDLLLGLGGVASFQEIPRQEQRQDAGAPWELLSSGWPKHPVHRRWGFFRHVYRCILFTSSDKHSEFALRNYSVR